MRWWKAIPHLQMLEEEGIVVALFGGEKRVQKHPVLIFLSWLLESVGSCASLK